MVAISDHDYERLNRYGSLVARLVLASHAEHAPLVKAIQQDMASLYRDLVPVFGTPYLMRTMSANILLAQAQIRARSKA